MEATLIDHTEDTRTVATHILAAMDSGDFTPDTMKAEAVRLAQRVSKTPGAPSRVWMTATVYLGMHITGELTPRGKTPETARAVENVTRAFVECLASVPAV